MPNLGNFPKRALLTGAGFTKNWGGHLASDIWPLLASSPVVRKSPALRTIFRNSIGYFEDALGQARRGLASGVVTADEIEMLEKDIVQVFLGQERTINDHCIAGTINNQNAEEMLSLFGSGPTTAGNRFAGIDTGYIFTLNQDLLVERITINGHAFHQPTTPGVAPFTDVERLGRDSFRPTNDRHLNETRRAGLTAPITLAGNLNYIKLHGSYEWRSDAGRNVLVVGDSKEETIRTFPVLAAYLDAFRAICSTPDLQLMVLGYGFGDEHINRIIADGARNSGLSLFVVDVRATPQTDRLLRDAGPDGIAIADRITGWSTKPLTETFPGPSSSHRSSEYRRILRDFFGWELPA